MYKLKFEIFVPDEPEDQDEGLKMILDALKNFFNPENFIQWQKETSDDEPDINKPPNYDDLRNPPEQD